ncbi:hypothetical protein CFC21_053904 [Triticum aestivum]|uniref:NB-ARC domain-containing protein n=2 Tax=Triticum aestivum TaxID=4565 RepID=A0A9R1K8E8_WHEAT|nr:hypothetical protein CFC21_053904 [Triticum aestivum]
MEDKMKDLEAVLLDADDKSRRGGVHGRVYERWLTKFNVEDVLDELDANELMSKTQSKVSIWFSRHNQFLQRITMPHKMQTVMKKVDEIEKEGKMRLNDVPRAATAQGNRNNVTFAANRNGMAERGVEEGKITNPVPQEANAEWSRNNNDTSAANSDGDDIKTGIVGRDTESEKTINHVPQAAKAQGSRNNDTFADNSNDDDIKSGIAGRGVEKDNIISLLLTSEGQDNGDDIQDISIIPVVGLGGIGKTTLVESVLADKRVSVFDVLVWVHVSKQFDLHKIETDILESMMRSNIKLDSWNLKEELAKRRYLIVLDDLWEEDGNNLKKLKEMLQHGREGSRIIVTTRNLSVVQKLTTGSLANGRKFCPVTVTEIINLGVLKPEDCWELMKQRAFGPDDDHSGLEEIGKQIAAKCGGLPLVANALGHVMSELRTVQAWEDIRDSKVDLGLKEGYQKETLERLMLSYYYMKIEFKMCFTYLAAFPKGFVMDNNHIIQQWNALGYINSRHDGQRCINYLLGMSFLRIPGYTSVSPNPLHFKAPQELVMHDLVHDLVSIIAADESIDLDATKSTSWNRARYCRHAQLTNFNIDPKIFKYIPGKLRSLHFRDLGGLQLPKKAFSRSKYIRVLDLSGHSAKGQSAPSTVVLPSSMNQLKLIRYLDATGLPITSLPKNFHALQNMETLILSNSLLETLPDSLVTHGFVN